MKIFNSNLVIKIIIIIFFSGTIYSCKHYLDYEPKGVVPSDVLNNTKGAELLATAAYASLGNGGEYSSVSDWLWGGIRSDDAYKGGASTGDQTQLNAFELFAYITNDQSYIQNVWKENYDGIAKANAALTVMNNLDENQYPLKLQRQAEMRFLRGRFYFWLVKTFKNVPWINETMTVAEKDTVSNRGFTQDQLWDKIAGDFQFGVDNLPKNQSQVGRPTKFAAEAYLAKTRLYQAYQQDELNNVTSLNPSRLQEVVALTDSIISSGKYALSEDFAENFLYEYENGPESVFAIQCSINDGTPIGRADWSHNLNYSMNKAYGCCSFNRPSDNMVNAFKTGDNGLPLFNTFNNSVVSGPEGFIKNSFDPRLDHTIGIPTHPFKYNPDFLVDSSWGRAPEVYGYYNPMKEIMLPESPALVRNGSRLGSAKNIDLIRYDDILLWKAEALIELGRQDEALPIINQIRGRAANSTGRLKRKNGTLISNYNIQKYRDGINCTWTQSYAREALRWERRLEFGMEGSRFFDLVRWGIAAETLNNYFQIESNRHSFLKVAHFQKNKNEYLPIPENEITLSRGLYKQNPGY